MRISEEQAVELLLAGEIVALPTETVYGLAGTLDQFDKIYTLKQRPKEKRFAIAISSLDMLDRFEAEIPADFYELTEQFWPGPLTLIVPTNEGTTAFRMPDQKQTLNIIDKSGPLVLTSANLSGQASATTPEEIESAFGEEFPIVDGGKCLLSRESTILTYNDNEWTILRQGAFDAELIKRFITKNEKQE